MIPLCSNSNRKKVKSISVLVLKNSSLFNIFDFCFIDCLVNLNVTCMRLHHSIRELDYHNYFLQYGVTKFLNSYSLSEKVMFCQCFSKKPQPFNFFGENLNIEKTDKKKNCVSPEFIGSNTHKILNFKSCNIQKILRNNVYVFLIEFSFRKVAIMHREFIITPNDTKDHNTNNWISRKLKIGKDFPPLTVFINDTEHKRL